MNNGLLRGFITLVVGILLLVMSDAAMELLIRLAGIAFLLPALVSLVSIYVTRKEAKTLPSVAISIIDVGSIAFGLWLLIYPLTFQDVFVKFMAILLFVVAIHQLYVILSARLQVKSRWQILVAPILLAVVAVCMFIWTGLAVSTFAMIVGVCAVVMALSDIIVALVLRKVMKDELKASEGGNGDIVKAE